jgi:hypothetical protein
MSNGAVSQGPGAAGRSSGQGTRRGQAQRQRAKRNPELEACFAALVFGPALRDLLLKRTLVLKGFYSVARQ